MTKSGEREGGTDRERETKRGRERRGGSGECCVQENNQALEERERKLKICIEFYIYEETESLTIDHHTIKCIVINKKYCSR